MTTDAGPSRAGSLSLVAGVLALDFANTTSGRGGGHRIEHLKDPHHVLEWATHAGALTQAAAGELQRDLATDLGLLADAVHLRDVIYRIAAALAQGTNADDTDLAMLRSAFAEHLSAGYLQRVETGAFAWRYTGTRSMTLGPIAQSAIDLLRDGALERLKQCPGADCGWLFYDRSKNNSRRWCEMSVCGNRTKARRQRGKAAFRAEEL